MFKWKGFEGSKESEIVDENSVINAEFKGEYKLEITDAREIFEKIQKGEIDLKFEIKL